jgi:hypothetical protein
MAATFLRKARSVATQVVVPFTGEGAYHGSTKPRPRPAASRLPPPLSEEMRATSLDALGSDGIIEAFDAVFPNLCQTLTTLPVPSQDAIRDDAVTFCWCPIDRAIQEAGPVTKQVLVAMSEHLEGKKRHIYIDSKVQYFQPGDVPVDSQHWHVDGSITVRGPEVERRGYGVLHDMRARMLGPATPPTYLTYQSSNHCATLFVTEPVTLRLPALIANFDELDRTVRALDPACAPQPAAAIVRFDGLSLHRAVAASEPGWRLWIRCVETDREVQLDEDIIECYGTVFRTARG